MKPLKTKISITVDEDLIVQIKEMAEKDDRSLSQYINLILKEWIAHSGTDCSEQQRTVFHFLPLSLPCYPDRTMVL